jgi:multiple sugar transport system substrate-binding protein
MKRITIIALTLALTGIPLFATGQQEAPTGGAMKATSNTVNENVTGTITVWHYFSVDSQVQELKDLAALFNKTYPNVKVDYVFVPYDQLPNKVVAAAAANTGPDVVLYNGPTIGQLVDADALKDLGPYWNSLADKDLFTPAVIHSINGILYGVQGYVNLLGLWYNKDILDKLGVKPPKTTSELTADMKKAVAAGYKGITLTGKPNDQGEWQAYPWLSAYGWSYGDPTAAAAEKAYGLMSSWVADNLLSKIVVTWGQAEPFQAFTVGDVAFAENGNWQLGTAKSSAKFQYGVVPMPSGSQNAKVYLGGEAESIGAFSKNPDLAWAYLKSTYFSKEGQLIAFRDVGSIPSRRDAAQDPAVTSDQLLSPFATEVQNMGQVYPPAVGPVTEVENAQLAVAQQWSAVIAGQTTPAAAAKKAVTDVQSELGK